MRIIALLALALLVNGCATHAENLNKLEVGMAKPDVIKALGNPDNRSFDGESEVLVYSMFDALMTPPYPHFVKLTDGKVSAWGGMNRGPVAYQPAPVYNFNIPKVDPAPFMMKPNPAPTNINCTTQRYGNTAYTNCR